MLGCLQTLAALAVTAVLVAVLAVGALWVTVERGPLRAVANLPVDVALGHVAALAIAAVDEDPALAPAPPAQVYPIAPSVPRVLQVPLVRAFDLMRATDEGARLFDQLVANDVLVSIEQLPYNAGYTATRFTDSGWVRSNIVIDADYVRSTDIPVLAAILVHEAVHADLAIRGEACYYSDACTTLPNGIQLEEEIAAHAVEAQWWGEMFGDDGRSLAFGASFGENTLLARWREGPAAFAAYVEEMRADEREGSGI
jgi:hypothetical protein